ncbi:uncharacterized protein LOC130561321 [Triplophysa rosa]|uniref:uncharacterized protein LOC130561321 n=1 Tax=Triplophysa rosa TaxID=992332 RepID=UPI002545F241|nr:uncharacterized protein LOC130561321 [Triplophysa rosa]
MRVIALLLSGSFIVALLPVITSATRYNWNIVCGDDLGCSPLVMRLMWIILMFFMNSALIYFYSIALENEKDCVGWACTIGFLQVIWTAWNCLYSFQDWGFTRVTIVYVFGSVGVILISAVGLMTELTLKTLNGEGLVGDLRIIVFSSESLLTVSVLIMIILAPCNYHRFLQCVRNLHLLNESRMNQCSQTATETPAAGSNQNQESHEMNTLQNRQETDRSKEETQPQSVESQK